MSTLARLKQLKQQEGFNLIELLIAVGIFTLLLPATVYFLISIFENFYLINSYDNAIIEGQRVMQQMVTEIRQGRQADNGAFAIADAQPGTVTFYANVDSSTSTERVRYWISGTNLLRGVITPTGDPPQYLTANEATSTLSMNLRNASSTVFSYYNENYWGTSTPLTSPINVGDVRFITIELHIDDDPTAQPTSTVFRSSAQIRGLKDNL